MIYNPSSLDDAERSICSTIDSLAESFDIFPVTEWRQSLWSGRLWRSMLAHAMGAGQSGEATKDSDALALQAVESARASNANYRRAMTFVLRCASDRDFRFSADSFKLIHSVLIEHDPGKQPGCLRRGPTAVRNAATGQALYTAPSAEAVRELLDETAAGLNLDDGLHPIVRAAMAHLNIACIHAFADGNGRLARCIHTLVLARAGYRSPSFCNLDEFCGRWTQRYQIVMNSVAGATWTPARDARDWIRFCLTGHLMQARGAEGMMNGLRHLADYVEQALREEGLSTRLVPILLDAACPPTLTHMNLQPFLNPAYVIGLEHLESAVKMGLLTRRRAGRVEEFAASDRLLAVANEVMSFQPEVDDPFGVLSFTGGAPAAGFWQVLDRECRPA